MHKHFATLFLAFSLFACAGMPSDDQKLGNDHACTILSYSAATFGGDVGGDGGETSDDRVWDVNIEGELTTYWPGPRAFLSLRNALDGTERIEVYASGWTEPSTFYGVTVTVLGHDPSTGLSEQIGEPVTTSGEFPPQLQTLHVAVPLEAYEWPEVLLQVASTGSPGLREFTGATLYRDCD
jgi:hypothetical protein